MMSDLSKSYWTRNTKPKKQNTNPEGIQKQFRSIESIRLFNDAAISELRELIKKQEAESQQKTTTDGDRFMLDGIPYAHGVTGALESCIDQDSATNKAIRTIATLCRRAEGETLTILQKGLIDLIALQKKQLSEKAE